MLAIEREPAQERGVMAGIVQKNVDQPDETVDYGDQGRSAKVSVGIAGYGLGSESTIWLSTLRPGWSWQRNIKPNEPFAAPSRVRDRGPHSVRDGQRDGGGGRSWPPPADRPGSPG
jgi:hypothetical protein